MSLIECIQNLSIKNNKVTSLPNKNDLISLNNYNNSLYSSNLISYVGQKVYIKKGKYGSYMICMDGSQEVERAFHWLEAIAMSDITKKTEVFLFHCVDKSIVNKLEFDTDPQVTRHKLAEHALDEYQRSLAVNNIISHKLLIDTKESVRDVIIKQSEVNKIDMLVLGHTNRNVLKKIIEGGSVCEYLVKKVNIPIVIFK